jgi:hypothetical protein
MKTKCSEIKDTNVKTRKGAIAYYRRRGYEILSIRSIRYQVEVPAALRYFDLDFAAIGRERKAVIMLDKGGEPDNPKRDQGAIAKAAHALDWDFDYFYVPG